MELNLTTPWGFSNIQSSKNNEIYYKNDQEITWKVNPGKINSLDVVFWILSPIVIDTILYYCICLYRYSFKMSKITYFRNK